MTRDDALAKIRDLLALAAGNANENEAAVAMAAASRLMEQHSIEQFEALRETEEVEPEMVERTLEGADGEQSKLAMWRSVLAEGIAKANGCLTFKTRVRIKHTRIAITKLQILGESFAVSTSCYLYAYAANQIDGFTDQAVKAHGRPGRTWANSFRMGCVERVIERYKEASAKNRDDARATASPGALVLASSIDEKIADQLARFFKDNLRTKKSAYTSDQQAAAAGRHAGDKVDLGLDANGRALDRGAAGALKSS